MLLRVAGGSPVLADYDGMYSYQAKKRAAEGGPHHVVTCDSGKAVANARRLLEYHAQM